MAAPATVLNPAKFRDADFTAKGESRASVALRSLDTLWFNTGTLCNIECAHCYIESSPHNDRLEYLNVAEVAAYLDQIEVLELATREIGFTGGEPFLNPQMPEMLAAVLARDYQALVLTNAMKPMMRPAVQEKLLALKELHGDRLTMRVSLDHYAREKHDEERGPGGYDATLEGMRWLSGHGYRMHVAGRTLWDEDEAHARAGYRQLFEAEAFAIDAGDPSALVLFPEMDERVDVPEISTACWGILGVDPASIMCATSRMVVKRRGAERPTVVACTLIPYDGRFDTGPELADALGGVKLNHPHCAKFCVLGGGSCTIAG